MFKGYGSMKSDKKVREVCTRIFRSRKAGQTSLMDLPANENVVDRTSVASAAGHGIPSIDR